MTPHRLHQPREGPPLRRDEVPAHRRPARVGLFRPGALFLLALALAISIPCLAQDPTVFYPSRYHPDSPDRAGATPIVLDPGGSRSGLILALPTAGGSATTRILAEGDGSPLAGILVEACVGRFTAVARTTADGRAVIPGVPAGLVSVRTRPDDPRSVRGDVAVRYAPGVVDSADALRLPLADATSVDMGSFSVPGAGRVKARVVRPEGGPWAGVPIVLREAGGAYRREASTGADGSVSFGGLEPGDYLLWADTRGTGAVPEAWDGSRDTLASTPLAVARGSLIEGIEISPDLGARILGKVRDEGTNTGLPDIEVRLFLADDHAVSYSFLTDDLGFYLAWGLPSGSYKIHVPAIRLYFPGVETEAQARAVSVVEPEEKTGYDLAGSLTPDCQLPPPTAGVIEGIIRADFNLVPSARVVVWSQADTVSQAIAEEGIYRIGCLTPGSYRAAFLPDGVYRTQYHPKTSDPDSAVLITVTAGDTAQTIDFKPELGVSIEGTVVSQTDGTPLAAVPVIGILDDPPWTVRVSTDADGLFQLDRLPDGTGLPAGAWIVGSDSITIEQVPVTPIRTIGLLATRVGADVHLEFLIPEGGPLLGWLLERTTDGEGAVRLIDAAGHPDGVRARVYSDERASNRRLAYRLSVERLQNGERSALRSSWVVVEPSTRLLLSPQPWDGRSAILLPHPVHPGKEVEMISLDGRRVARGGPDGSRIVIGKGSLATGVYFLRWLGTDGRAHTERLVLKR